MWVDFLCVLCLCVWEGCSGWKELFTQVTIWDCVRRAVAVSVSLRIDECKKANCFQRDSSFPSFSMSFCIAVHCTSSSSIKHDTFPTFAVASPPRNFVLVSYFTRTICRSWSSSPNNTHRKKFTHAQMSSSLISRFASIVPSPYYFVHRFYSFGISYRIGRLSGATSKLFYSLCANLIVILIVCPAQVCFAYIIIQN